MPGNSRAATHPCAGAVCLEAVFKRPQAQKQHITSVSCCKAGAIMETKHWSLTCHACALSAPACCPRPLCLSPAIVPHCAPGPMIPSHLLSCPPSSTAPPAAGRALTSCLLITDVPHRMLSPLACCPPSPTASLTCCRSSLAVFPSPARGTALFR